MEKDLSLLTQKCKIHGVDKQLLDGRIMSHPDFG
jgi:hypothetical protein